MHVFITGGTGFVGSAVIAELIAAKHTVTGLARTPEAAAKLAIAGVKPRTGELSDLPSLRSAVVDADAVIHCAFIHDFSNFAASVTADLIAVKAMVDALASAGPGKIFINTCGTVMLPSGRAGIETDPIDAASPMAFRLPSEQQATRVGPARGLRSAVVRLPPSVHDVGDHGFIPILMDLATKTGVSAYIGDGNNRWAAVHRKDAGLLYRLAVEKLANGTIAPGSALHAIGDTGIPFREIAAAIADQLKLGPPQSRTPDHFGWFGMFAGIDNPMSAAITQRLTGWLPTRVGLLADVLSQAYAREKAQ